MRGSRPILRRSSASARSRVSDQVLVKLDAARTALAQAQTIQQAKKIMDIAGAAEIYAKRQHLSEEAIGYAHSIKIEALRRLGEILKDSPKAKGAPGPGRGKAGSPAGPAFDPTPTYADSGLSKKTAALAQKLAELPKKQFEEVCEGAKSVTQAIREVIHAKRPAVVPPTGTYRVFYADPPWAYGNAGLQQYGHASHHYPTMQTAELCALPIAKLAQADAVLFLWVTSPLLEESFQVIGAWGFKYKTSFVWDKVRHNFGHYNSVRHEFLLVCTRGSCTPDIKTLHDSVQTIEREEHSAKPEQFREIIDELYPDGARIELFARGGTPRKWKRWGNE